MPASQFAPMLCHHCELLTHNWKRGPGASNAFQVEIKERNPFEQVAMLASNTKNFIV